MPAWLGGVLAAFAAKTFAKVIGAFGIGIVSYIGYKEALDYIKGIVDESIHSLPSELFQILMLMGVGQGLGYVFGAMAFYVSFKSMKKLELAYQ